MIDWILKWYLNMICVFYARWEWQQVEYVLFNWCIKKTIKLQLRQLYNALQLCRITKIEIWFDKQHFVSKNQLIQILLAWNIGILIVIYYSACGMSQVLLRSSKLYSHKQCLFILGELILSLWLKTMSMINNYIFESPVSKFQIIYS